MFVFSQKPKLLYYHANKVGIFKLPSSLCGKIRLLLLMLHSCFWVLILNSSEFIISAIVFACLRNDTTIIGQFYWQSSDLGANTKQFFSPFILICGNMTIYDECTFKIKTQEHSTLSINDSNYFLDNFKLTLFITVLHIWNSMISNARALVLS